MRTKRPIVTFSDAALTRLRVIQGRAPEKTLRLALKTKGCAGQAYDLSLVGGGADNGQRVEKASDRDHFIDKDGIRLAIDSAALLFLIGTHIDYIEEDLYTGFTFSNPNQVDACGCGESVMLRAAIPREEG